jgi:hypothetical protein
MSSEQHMLPRGLLIRPNVRSSNIPSLFTELIFGYPHFLLALLIASPDDSKEKTAQHEAPGRLQRVRLPDHKG